VLEQWLTALYGGDVALGIPTADMTDRLQQTFKPVDSAQCQRWIRKCHRHIDEFLDEQRLGTLKDMHTKQQFDDLEQCLRWSELDLEEVEDQDDGTEHEEVGDEGSS
jgi:hypothetical protein